MRHDEAMPSSWGAQRSKEVSWYDPATLADEAAKLSGRDFLQGIVDGRLPPPPIAELLGMRLVSVGDGEALFACEPDEAVYNPIGTVHGGWLCTLLDSAAGCAIHSTLPAGVGYSSTEIKVSFLKALRADAGVIEVTGRVLRVGRRIGFAEAHARNLSGDVVGHATASAAILGNAAAPASAT
jgi:uncharacterized protein (TIGR00369 family)